MHTKSIRKLIDLCYYPNPYLQRQACRVINSIAAYPTGVYWDILKDAGAIEALQHIIDNAPKDRVRLFFASSAIIRILIYIRMDLLLFSESVARVVDD